ncbi:hypothetical protein FACS189437_01510 [Bacteroidia bacterium]|nr:hypothetical protein FACS189437_01510 [Bacteroidia bacterium]
MNKLHIGLLIKQKVKERGITNSDLARSIHRTRQTVNNIYDRPSIDTDLLGRISDALDHDFFDYYKKNILQKSILLLLKLRNRNSTNAYPINQYG